MGASESRLPEYEGPAIVHLLGRHKVAGIVKEVTIAGRGFLRIDVPEVPGPPAENGAGRPVLFPAHTIYRSGEAVYGLDPVTEDTVRRLAPIYRQEPATRWEIREADRADKPDRPEKGFPGHDHAQDVDFGEEEDLDPRGHEAGDDEDDDYDQENGL